MHSKWLTSPDSNTSKCKIISDKNWWYANKWKEVIFYGVAPAFAPSSTPATGCGTCLQIAPSASSGKQLVIIAAGRKLPGQNRTSNADKGTITNYLELENSTPAGGVFHQDSTTASYNDQTVFWPRL
jgi:hypothetical protein